MDNLKAMDKFLERYNLPTLNQEERENKNRPKVLIEIMIKNLPKRKSRTRGITGQFYQIFGEKLSSILMKLFQKIAEGGAHPRPPPPWYQSQWWHKKENYRPVSMVNIDAKILNKILANRIQKCIKRIIYNDQVWFIPGIQTSSIFKNQSLWYTKLTNKNKDILSSQ